MAKRTRCVFCGYGQAVEGTTACSSPECRRKYLKNLEDDGPWLPEAENGPCPSLGSGTGGGDRVIRSPRGL